jgi:uncharacterized protein YdcH (DUF465 family)
VDISKKTVSSDAITNKDAELRADAMKAQDAPEYQKSVEKHRELNKVNFNKAVAVGAATNAIVTTVQEIVNVIKNRDNLPEDQFVQSVTNILCGTAEGAIRGGAIVSSVQLLGKALGKAIPTNSIGAVPAMAVANTAVDFAKDLYRCFVTSTIDTDDLLCNTINNTFSSFSGFGGALVAGHLGGKIAIATFASAKTAVATGAAIGSAVGPIGTIVGSVVGGLVIGIGANAIIGIANKDAQKAFTECVSAINTTIELHGCAKLYYFADSMSSISDFRLSFKNLLPCYNLISDLKEYNLRRKAIRNIHEQLDANIANIETAKTTALQKIEEWHNHRLFELRIKFNEQRDAMFSDFKESMNIYVANSYSQYVGMFDVMSGNVEDILTSINKNISSHNVILEYARNRNKANELLNDTLVEITQDPESSKLLNPFVDKLIWFMQQDEMMVGRQYLSFDEALYLVRRNG